MQTFSRAISLLSLGLVMSMPGRADIPALPGDNTLSEKALLGKKLFFDTNLSEPAGQSCAACHNPGAAFTDADKSAPTSKGADPSLHGNRNAPTAMYAAYSPTFYYATASGDYIGGQFLDGRAATLAIQAQKPFLNPLEMANPDVASLVAKVRDASYAALFEKVYERGALNSNTQAFGHIADALAAFERSRVLNRFSSKYDYYLFGKASFTQQESRGRLVFEDAKKGNCAACHPSRASADGTPPLFTDHTYDNLGVPRNANNPYYELAGEYNPQAYHYIDYGLGGQLNLGNEDGRFKVPTLRNITRTAPYMHNGYFPTLRSVVEFYNSRDTRRRCSNMWTTAAQALAQNCWPAPEVENTVNHQELGSLNLSVQQIDDLLAFLSTLNDGYKTESPWQVKVPQQ